MKFIGGILICVILISFSISAGSGVEIDEPLRELYKKIQPGMLHTEVDSLLKRYSPDSSAWSIHERDLRKRNDFWSVSLEHYFRNPFTDNEYISYNLDIYFIEEKVECIFFRLNGEKVREKFSKGSSCGRFSGI